jgi:calcineurin-like phosphoesterase family protein
MAKNTQRFVISDTHFGHENSWKLFKRADGSPLRPFDSTEEMNEAIIERWNAKVKEQDTVYHLGDVVIAKRNLELVKRLNGRKILIAGNHDIFKNKDYFDAGFAEIRGCRVFTDKFILTHIPLHPDSVSQRFRVNVHGHLHFGEVMRQCELPEMRHLQEPDPRYLCVSVEMTDFAPLHFDEVEARIQARWAKTGYKLEGRAWGNGSNPG